MGPSRLTAVLRGGPRSWTRHAVESSVSPRGAVSLADHWAQCPSAAISNHLTVLGTSSTLGSVPLSLALTAARRRCRCDRVQHAARLAGPHQRRALHGWTDWCACHCAAQFEHALMWTFGRPHSQRRHVPRQSARSLTTRWTKRKPSARCSALAGPVLHCELHHTSPSPLAEECAERLHSSLAFVHVPSSSLCWTLTESADFSFADGLGGRRDAVPSVTRARPRVRRRRTNARALKLA